MLAKSKLCHGLMCLFTPLHTSGAPWLITIEVVGVLDYLSHSWRAEMWSLLFAVMKIMFDLFLTLKYDYDNSYYDWWIHTDLIVTTSYV